MSRSKKPTELKVLQGTSRKDRDNPKEPKVQAGGLSAPEYLTDSQVEFFNYFAAQVGEILLVAGVSDSTALASLAIVTSDIADDNVLLSIDGPYITKEDGNVIAHPATRRLSQNLQRQQALMNEFGLTPASRSKVSAMGKGEENPFAAIGEKSA